MGDVATPRGSVCRVRTTEQAGGDAPPRRGVGRERRSVGGSKAPAQPGSVSVPRVLCRVRVRNHGPDRKLGAEGSTCFPFYSVFYSEVPLLLLASYA